MVQCIGSADLFAMSNTVYRETFSLSTPVETVITTATTTTIQSSIEIETEVPGGTASSKKLLRVDHVVAAMGAVVAATMAL